MGSDPAATTTEAPAIASSARARNAGHSVNVQPSLTIVASPASSLTIVTVRRRSAAVSTATNGMPHAARSAANSSPVGPPTGATTVTSSPSACSTRATLTALPPARAETVCARLVACSRKRSTP